MHSVILIAGLISRVAGNPVVVPTLATPPAVHYGQPGQSHVGAHHGYGYKLNHSDAVEIAIAKKGAL